VEGDPHMLTIGRTVEQIKLDIEEERKLRDIRCPHCGAVEEEYNGFVTYWGSDGSLQECGCSACGKDFLVEERVERTFICTPKPDTDESAQSTPEAV
jgi:DNA-directed RNA polymerase subunit RPC12/RpoP